MICDKIWLKIENKILASAFVYWNTQLTCAEYIGSNKQIFNHILHTHTVKICIPSIFHAEERKKINNHSIECWYLWNIEFKLKIGVNFLLQYTFSMLFEGSTFSKCAKLFDADCAEFINDNITKTRKMLYIEIRCVTISTTWCSSKSFDSNYEICCYLYMYLQIYTCERLVSLSTTTTTTAIHTFPSILFVHHFETFGWID